MTWPFSAISQASPSSCSLWKYACAFPNRALSISIARAALVLTHYEHGYIK